MSGLINQNELKRLRDAWINARQRCYNPKDPSFQYYGARGITVFPKWLGSLRWKDKVKSNKGTRVIPVKVPKNDGFKDFLIYVLTVIGPPPKGKRPSGMPVYTLERIDNNLGYQPGNIRWATYLEQNRNKRKCTTRKPKKLVAYL